MYKKAAQLKLRFSTTIGELSVEQLYTLPVNDPRKLSLKAIAVNLHEQIQKSNATGLDFLDDVSKADPLLELRFAIIKDIIETKKAESDEKTAAKARQQEIQLLEDLIAKKKLAATEELSVTDLEARLKALKA